MSNPIDVAVRLGLDGKPLKDGATQAAEAFGGAMDQVVDAAQEAGTKAAGALDGVGQAGADAGKEIDQALDGAGRPLDAIDEAARRAGRGLDELNQATRGTEVAQTPATRAVERATQAVRDAEAAVTAAAKAKTGLGVPADTRAAQAALEAAKAQQAQAEQMAAVERAAQAVAQELTRAGASSDVFAAALPKPDALRQVVSQLEAMSQAVDPAVAQRAKELADELQRMAAQRDAVQALRELTTEHTRARGALLEHEQALERFRQELGQAGTATALQARQERDLERAAAAARDTYVAASNAMAAAAQRARQAGVDVEAVAAAERAAAAEAVKMGAAAQAAAAQQVRGAQQAVAANADVRQSLTEIHTQVRAVAAAAAAVVGGQMMGGLAGDLAKTADEVADLRARIKLLTGDGEAFAKTWVAINDVALRTNSSLIATGDLFVRIARAGQQMNLAQNEALRLTETVNKAIRVSGGSAQAADAAIEQLIQGLNNGVLRGDEFNSVVSQAPRLTKAMADGLGVAESEMRKLADAGALTSETIISSLRGQAAVIDQEYAKLPPSVGRALTNLGTRWREYIDDVNQASDATKTAAQAIDFIGRHIDDLVSVLYTLGKAALAWQVLKMWESFKLTQVAAAGAAVGIGEATAATAANAAASRAAIAAGRGHAETLTAQALAARTYASVTGAVSAGLGRLTALVGGPAGALVTVALFHTEIKRGIEWVAESIARFNGWGAVMRENNRVIAESEARLKRIQEEATRLAPSVGAIAIAYQKQNEANEKAVELAKKRQGAQEQEAATTKALAGMYGDTERALTMMNDAAQISAQRAEEVAQAQERAAATLDMQAAKMRAAAEASGKMSKATQEEIKAIEQRRDAALADAQASRAQAEAAKVEAQERALAIAKTADHGRSIDALREAYVGAQKNVERLTELERLGWVTRKEVEQATRLAGAAYQLYADAMQDAISKQELLLRQTQIEAQVRSQKASAAVQEAQIAERVARAQGNETAATEALIRQKWAEVAATREATRAAIAEAEAQIRVLEAKRAAITASGDEADAKRREIELSIQEQQVKIESAKASSRVTDALIAEIDAYRSASAAGGSYVATLNSIGAAAESAAEKVYALGEARVVVESGGLAGIRTRGAQEADSLFLRDYQQRTGSDTTAGASTQAGIASQLKGMGLTDAQAAAVARDFVDSQGNVSFYNNPGLTKYGGSSLAEAMENAARQALAASSNTTRAPNANRTGAGTFGSDGRRFGDSGGALGWGDSPTQQPVQAPATSPAPAPTQASPVYVTNVTLGAGGKVSQIRLADASSQALLASLLAELDADSRRANY